MNHGSTLLNVKLYPKTPLPTSQEHTSAKPLWLEVFDQQQANPCRKDNLNKPPETPQDDTDPTNVEA